MRGRLPRSPSSPRPTGHYPLDLIERGGCPSVGPMRTASSSPRSAPWSRRFGISVDKSSACRSIVCSAVRSVTASTLREHQRRDSRDCPGQRCRKCRACSRRGFHRREAQSLFARRTGRGRGLARAVERVRAVREAIGPSVDLMVDCLGMLDFATARRALDLLAPYDLFWFEEPFPQQDVALLARLRARSDTRLVGGEQLCGRDAFRPLLEAGSYDVLNPDIKWVGGIFEAKKIAAFAEMYGVGITPHNMSGPVATAASAHLAATLPNFLILEYCWGVTPWRDALIDGTELIADGYLHLSDRPGLGITLDQVSWSSIYYCRRASSTDGSSPL